MKKQPQTPHNQTAMIDAHKDGRRLACLADFTRSDLDNYALRCFETADERIALIAGFLAEKRRICPEWFAPSESPMTESEALRAILVEAETAESGDEACAENSFKRIVALAIAALAGTEAPEWAGMEIGQ